MSTEIMTDEELHEMNIHSHATLEFMAENFTKLFKTIANLKAEQDEYKHRLQNMIDIYETKKYDEPQ